MVYPISGIEEVGRIVDGIVTTVTDVRAPQTEGDGAYYDLTGRRVDNPSQGIYIRNHQKVLVK